MGHWKRNPAQWYEQTMIYCDLCGKIIPKRLWIVDESGRDLVFCDPSCEQLYWDYRAPAEERDDGCGPERG